MPDYGLVIIYISSGPIFTIDTADGDNIYLWAIPEFCGGESNTGPDEEICSPGDRL